MTPPTVSVGSPIGDAGMNIRPYAAVPAVRRALTRNNNVSFTRIISALAIFGVVLFGTVAAHANEFVQGGKVLVVPKGSRVQLTDFVTQQGAPADIATSATISWDDNGLTVEFTCEDGEIVTQQRDRDDQEMWQDDGVEVFLDPGHTHDFSGKWVHVLVTAAGAVMDQRGPGESHPLTGDPKQGNVGFTAKDMRTTVNPTDNGWRATIFLPWSDLGAKPTAGDVWGMNLNRTDHPQGRYLCWSPTFGPFLKIHRWGHLVFADEQGDSSEALQGIERVHAMLIERTNRINGFISAVTRGEGFMPWQPKDRMSPKEQTFRQEMEKRKDELLANRKAVRHPTLISEAQFATARRNIAETQWGKAWFNGIQSVSDYIIAQPEGYIESMIPELTATNPYGFTCPNCVGKKSLEGAGVSLIVWDHRNPDVMSCRACGQVYPDERFPETATLVAPRRDQVFTFYLNDAQRANPDDRTGGLAWKWVGMPINVSFTGIIRRQKILFMAKAAESLGLTYQLTGDERYAKAAVRILERFAHCLPNWLYHDYWDTFADCDPLYAAWHFRSLELEWKRHLSASAYAKDEPDKASMLQSFWGAGRVHPSADTMILNDLVPAYDLVADARGADGKPIWSEESRRRVERDLILEQLFTGEPFVGGVGKATNMSNKAPYVYQPMALVGKTLGVADFVHVALMGYEGLRDQSFLFDGFSHESPAYTDMFLRGIINVPEALEGFVWPEGFPGRRGVVSVFKDDPKMKQIMRTAIESIAPNGCFLPLSDTMVGNSPSALVFEIGLRHYPEFFSGALPSIYQVKAVSAAKNPRRQPGREAVADRSVLRPTQYAVFNLRESDLLADDLRFREMLFPAWKTAVLRHGSGPDAAVAALSFNPMGGHRHLDNLGLYYMQEGREILAEQGYVGDSVMRAWGGSTLSHNLVVVDDKDQLFSDPLPRVPSLRLMAASPRVAVVEAESRAYKECTTYRRLVAMIKGPEGRTLLVDIFRVEGGRKHAYRLFSNLAASDSPEGALEFEGLEMPPEPPLPDFAASVRREHVYGLRDVRRVANPPKSWTAMWREQGYRYRLHFLGQVHAVEASNGPGQQSQLQVGRRVRYLDAVNKGQGGRSTFVAVHEPWGGDDEMPVISAERLETPVEAGPDAVALRLHTRWGDYLILNEFDAEASVDGVRFRGRFGVFGVTPQGQRWLMSCAASTMETDGFGFSDEAAAWSGRITNSDPEMIETSNPRPKGWREAAHGTTAWVRIGQDGVFTGYPVKETENQKVFVKDFMMQPGVDFEVPAVRYLTAPTAGK